MIGPSIRLLDVKRGKDRGIEKGKLGKEKAEEG